MEYKTMLDRTYYGFKIGDYVKNKNNELEGKIIKMNTKKTCIALNKKIFDTPKVITINTDDLVGYLTPDFKIKKFTFFNNINGTT